MNPQSFYLGDYELTTRASYTEFSEHLKKGSFEIMAIEPEATNDSGKKCMEVTG